MNERHSEHSWREHLSTRLLRFPVTSPPLPSVLKSPSSSLSTSSAFQPLLIPGDPIALLPDLGLWTEVDACRLSGEMTECPSSCIFTQPQMDTCTITWQQEII
ncbi:hypothetical protein ATANTOWER_010136 [Ataeniobius toweri]|uniref:Uncharacterized protein n=1 Tax=Ataeniobius toweri TaxID=208326 RepID=A0ABU7ANW1_9TELE|nr:hypothetical protein [Ataeniobius toweri]